MRRVACLIVCLFIMFVFCQSEDVAQSKIRVMTFNIRVDIESDKENAWPHRKEMVASTIRFHHADLVGIQEALAHQVKELSDQLPMYEWVGVGRDDGEEAGEFMAIFYLKSRFKLKNEATFWLSETSDQPGLGWDAACNRVVTWAQFEDRLDGNSFYHFNAHFDHMGETARQESAKLLLSSIQDIAGLEPAIVTGDLNSNPKSEVYRILTHGVTDSSGFKLFDTEHASFFAHHGPYTTFNKFALQNLIGNPKLIDYIFITPQFNVLNHGTLTDTYDGRFPSDHFPVLAEVYLGSLNSEAL